MTGSGSARYEVVVEAKNGETAAEAQHVRKIIEQTQAQLDVNETAFLYIKIAEDQHTLIKVNRPQQYSDLNSWKRGTEPVTGTLSIPQTLPEGYHFIRGMSDSTVGIMDNSWVTKYTNVLKKRIKPGEDYAWIKSFDVPNRISRTVSPFLVYEGPGGEKDTIEVSYSPSGTDAQLSANFKNTVKVEEVKVGNINAFYVENDDAYDEEDSGYHAYISWIEDRGPAGISILHGVSTNSPTVTREDLLQVAEGLR